MRHKCSIRWSHTCSAQPGYLLARLTSPLTTPNISSLTNRSTITKFFSSLNNRCALIVSKSGSPGPAPSNVIRPPLGRDDGGFSARLDAVFITVVWAGPEDETSSLRYSYSMRCRRVLYAAEMDDGEWGVNDSVEATASNKRMLHSLLLLTILCRSLKWAKWVW